MSYNNGTSISKLLLGIVLLPFWYMQLFQKRDPKLWVFGSWFGVNCSDNSATMYHYVINNRPDIKAIWITKNKAVYAKLRSENKPVEMYNSWRGIKTVLKAGFLLVTHSTNDINCFCSNGANLVNLWHGMPMKQIGRTEKLRAKDHTTWKKIKTICRKIITPYDFQRASIVTVSSPFFIPYLSYAMELPEAVFHTTGLARNDELFSDATDQYIATIRKQYDNPTILLYLPTFRDQLDTFNPFTQWNFPEAAFENALKANNIILLHKAHFCNNKETQETNHGTRIIDISNVTYDSLYLLMKDVDVLITDYSSIYFDYILLNKSVILTPFDIEEYTTESRALFFDYNNTISAQKTYSWEEVLEQIKKNDFGQIPATESTKFNSCTDGNSCQRITELIISKTNN